MSTDNIDDQSPYGTFATGAFANRLLSVTRSLPTSWLGRRAMFIIRRLARLSIGAVCDTELFGARLRMYSQGNVSEKRALYAPQFFDLEERQALRDLAEDNAVFIDIGANIGLYSFSTAAAFKQHRNTRIIAVEPHPVISKRLAYNLSLNPEMPIEPMVMALGDRDGHMTLVSSTDNLGESRLLQSDETADNDTVEVPVKTLLGLLEAQKVERLDGMKIDIEGYEEAVLTPFFEQAPEALLPRLIIIEKNLEQWKTDLIKLAARRNYKPVKTTRMNLMLERVKD